ncbi:unnamed protein product [Paramecium sonneborni]|uniref:Uncharacterized protein n=1 Tax=Paramecium sonneborni TaxID=65129 RepID=A0A8S1QPX9_9CILI|nr:unnamed protein product [Paramecium sonneborni]
MIDDKNRLQFQTQDQSAKAQSMYEYVRWKINHENFEIYYYFLEQDCQLLQVGDDLKVLYDKEANFFITINNDNQGQQKYQGQLNNQALGSEFIGIQCFIGQDQQPFFQEYVDPNQQLGQYIDQVNQKTNKKFDTFTLHDIYGLQLTQDPNQYLQTFIQYEVLNLVLHEIQIPQPKPVITIQCFMDSDQQLFLQEQVDPNILIGQYIDQVKQKTNKKFDTFTLLNNNGVQLTQDPNEYLQIFIQYEVLNLVLHEIQLPQPKPVITIQCFMDSDQQLFLQEQVDPNILIGQYIDQVKQKTNKKFDTFTLLNNNGVQLTQDPNEYLQIFIQYEVLNLVLHEIQLPQPKPVITIQCFMDSDQQLFLQEQVDPNILIGQYIDQVKQKTNKKFDTFTLLNNNGVQLTQDPNEYLQIFIQYEVLNLVLHEIQLPQPKPVITIQCFMDSDQQLFLQEQVDPNILIGQYIDQVKQKTNKKFDTFTLLNNNGVQLTQDPNEYLQTFIQYEVLNLVLHEIQLPQPKPVITIQCFMDSDQQLFLQEQVDPNILIGQYIDQVKQKTNKKFDTFTLHDIYGLQLTQDPNQYLQTFIQYEVLNLVLHEIQIPQPKPVITIQCFMDSDQQLFLQEQVDPNILIGQYIDQVKQKTNKKFDTFTLHDIYGLQLTQDPNQYLQTFIQYEVLNLVLHEIQIPQQKPVITIQCFMDSDQQPFLQEQVDPNIQIGQYIDQVKQKYNKKSDNFTLYDITGVQLTQDPNQYFQTFIQYQVLSLTLYQTQPLLKPINYQSKIAQMKESIQSFKNFSLYFDPSGEFVIYKYHLPIQFEGCIKKSKSTSSSNKYFTDSEYKWFSAHQKKYEFAELDQYSFAIKWEGGNLSILKLKQK